MAFPTLGLNPGIGEEGFGQTWGLVENVQFPVRCRHGEGHPLPRMADGTAKFLDGVMCRQDVAMRMRSVWLPSCLKAGAIDAHVAGLTSFHAHERLVEVGIVQSGEDDLLDLRGLGHPKTGQYRSHDFIHALAYALIVRKPDAAFLFKLVERCVGRFDFSLQRIYTGSELTARHFEVGHLLLKLVDPSLIAC